MSEIPIKCSREVSNVCQEHVFVLLRNNEYVRVAIDDIMYLEADSDCCDIVTSDSSRMLVTSTLHEVLANLPQTKFIRVHRSYALNISFIVKIIGNQIELMDGTKVLIGRTYHEQVLSKFIFIGPRKRTQCSSQ